ncbi:MAG: DNA polymerase III subunit alpha [Atopobiaceae bacterium]|nr:DNA polymerase III subunit alpha [Atopobiaceae bacterium]
MAFVHLHNHSDRSLLDGATRIKDMVKRAVDLGMPAVALTDHGYMYGIPDLALAADGYNNDQADYKQWKRDVECFQKGRPVEEPQPDAPDAKEHDRAHAQWEADVAAWERAHDVDDVRAVRPRPLVKAILGCEVYFTPDSELRRDRKPELYHLILLAKDHTGYVNLMQIVSDAATRGMYYKPRVTLEMLQEHAEGLICTSACVSGIIPRSILRGQPDEAMRWARTFKETFAPGDFYIEIQDHGNTFNPQNERGTVVELTDRQLDERLVRLAHSLDLKVVATNDFHYLLREDAPTQDIMMCIGMNAQVDDENRMRMHGTEYYMKSEDEMRELFSWCPEALETTLEIADKCNVELEWGKILLPQYPLDPGETNESQFRRECEAGLARRYGENWREREIAGVNVLERFEHEYKVICDKGFAAYFLIVADYVRWAKEHGIGVGPGRGSAAGAIVAYAMDITSFDPLENGLMFERFLSIERSEMPDIDMDFDDERRLEVIDYVRHRYGADHVTHVITYSTIKAKQAINDANRVLGYPVWQGQKLSKMISNAPNATLFSTMNKESKNPDQYSPDFVDAYEHDPNARRIIDAALSIEGLTRGEGVHACAVLIAPGPVHEHVPTKLDTKGGVEITQYEGHTIADMGLLKMDFLGLRTLTVISKAVANIRANHGITIVPDDIPFDDPAIFELMSRGHTAGVFQIESGGMTATIKSMRPKEYKHVVAMIALYRPGPLQAGMVSDYIDRMNGRKQVTFYDDRLREILSETYGTIVYQEQVMQISMVMCGFSAGESDSRIRKPVAKKKIKLLTDTMFHWDDGKDETTYDHWMNGAERNGYRREIAQKIWDDVLEFASYAFNKSHSAGYAILVMQTAWLKAHYPKEYMAAVLTSYMGKTEKIVHYVASCRREGIAVLPPDINESGRDFTATADGIRFGFAGIRGVGEGAADAIIAEREAGGPFRNLHDFVERVDTAQANRRVIEALIKAGAFDSTGYTRMQCMGFVDKGNPANIIDAAAKRQKDRSAGQSSMFDLFADVEGFGSEAPPSDGVEWDRHLKLNQEKEVLGLYVSDHPLRPYEYALSKARDYAIADLDATVEVPDSATGVLRSRPKVADGRELWLAGMVSGVTKRVTKSGDPMAIVRLEDMGGEVDVVVFPKLFKKSASVLSGEVDEMTGEALGDVFVRVHGAFERSDRGNQVRATEIEPMELNERTNRPKVLEIHMPSRMLSRELMERLQGLLGGFPGLDRVELRVESSSSPTMRLELPVRVEARNMSLYASVADMIGGEGKVRIA